MFSGRPRHNLKKYCDCRVAERRLGMWLDLRTFRLHWAALCGEGLQLVIAIQRKKSSYRWDWLTVFSSPEAACVPVRSGYQLLIPKRVQRWFAQNLFENVVQRGRIVVEAAMAGSAAAWIAMRTFAVDEFESPTDAIA